MSLPIPNALRTGHRAHPLLIVVAIVVVIGLLYPLQMTPSVFTCSPVSDLSLHGVSQNQTTAPVLQEVDEPDTLAKYEAEEKLHNGVLKYSRIWPERKPELIWLTLTQNNDSWGREGEDKPMRTIKDLLSVIKAQYSIEEMSIGLLTSSTDEYELYKKATNEYDFARITIFFYPNSASIEGVNRKNRHDGDVQTQRRREIAKLRNYLMLRATEDEKHIIWQDADVMALDKGIVRRMIAHSDAREDVGIITARCSLGSTPNYDWNAWQGTREGPRGWDLDQKEIDAGEGNLQGQKKVDHLLPGTNNDDLIPLDTVGATILYIRSSLIWMGVSFTTYYAVGTRWGKDGWDGIESEGICYVARGLPGGSCMLMGGDWHVSHTTG